MNDNVAGPRAAHPGAAPRRALTHVAPDGAARMVDVGGKAVAARVARAAGAITMAPAAFTAVRADAVAKGDVLGVARVAGILAAKRTADLIPLCHPLPITGIDLTLLLDAALPGVRVEGR